MINIFHSRSFVVFCLFCILFCSCIYAEASPYNIPSSIRYTIEREEGESPIVYYFTTPEINNDSYPILILCEGSSNLDDIDSVYFIRDYLSARVQPLHVGYLTIEKWGVDGNDINKNEFWNHYSRSQRLIDHLRVIKHLEESPPCGWDGRFIFIGVSEGGPLVTDLSILCPNTVATINWVGAGDWNWADELWEFFENYKKNSLWIRIYDAILRWCSLPWEIPQNREEYDALFEYIINNPVLDESLAGLSYFYHADAFQRPSIDYSKIHAPFLVVEGTKDNTIYSCDLFVQKAIDAGAPITYFRIEGMDHWIRKRPDVIDLSFEWLKDQL